MPTAGLTLAVFSAPFLIALLWLAFPAYAAPEPIVFDFEDGLQGWTLEGSAQRVQTGLRGELWAILGDGVRGSEASIRMELDWTNIASITVEQFYVSGHENGLHSLVLSKATGGGNQISFPQFDVVESGNPSLLTLNAASLMGSGLVEITWENSLPNTELPSVVAFMDNITFHPVPEPSRIL